MHRRLILLFAVPFIALTALDVATTRLAIHSYGFQELNPLTDATSVWSMAAPEIATFVAGALLLLLGAAWKGKELRTHADRGFVHFFNHALQPRHALGALFIVAPILLAIGRIFPVWSNAWLLSFGWTPFDGIRRGLSSLLGLGRNGAQGFMLVLLFVFFFWPVLYLVFRAIRNTRDEPGGKPDPETRR